MTLENRFLSHAEIEKIHEESIKILSDIGVRFAGNASLEIVKKYGARVNKSNRTAYIPEELVRNALDAAPKSFVLGARVPEYDFPLPSPFSGYTLDGAATFARDFHTGERRMATMEDNHNALRVFDEMELGSIVWPPVQVGDVPSQSSVVNRFITSFMSSFKHIQDELHHPRETEYVIEALTAILGGEDAAKERKIASVTYCPIAPLVHDGDMAEAYIELGKFGVPVNILPMPACGSTGPAGLFSNIAVANAEGLSAVVLFQAANPGAPCIFGSAPGTIDFRSSLFLAGTPEMVLQAGAMSDMAHHYGLPSLGAGCLSDAKSTGSQAVIEKLLTTLPLVLGGLDLVNGMGLIESSQLLVLEQIVVDNEIAHLAARMREGIDSSPKKNYFSDVAEVGPGGHFLMADSTVQACRSSEFYRPRLMNRDPYEVWEKLGKPDMYMRAREKVERILESPHKHPLDDSAAGRLQDIVRRAEKELGAAVPTG
jgi:trimethylamine---corrinoid protein Co-methyltransferase